MIENKIITKWYHSSWGVALAGIVGLFVVLAVVFLSLMFKYLGEIKNGGGEALKQKFYQGFDKAVTENPNAKLNRSEIESADSPFFGNPQAKITIVEFIDYKCSNSKAAAPIINKLLEKYAYKVKVIVRNFPGESIHPGADKLARLAYCAFEQGKFWETNTELFSQQESISSQVTDGEIDAVALKAGLDKTKLEHCLKSEASAVRVNKDYADGYKAGVAGTPTFFVNGEKVEGVVPYEAWEDFIKKF